MKSRARSMVVCTTDPIHASAIAGASGTKIAASTLTKSVVLARARPLILILTLIRTRHLSHAVRPAGQQEDLSSCTWLSDLFQRR